MILGKASAAQYATEWGLVRNEVLCVRFNGGTFMKKVMNFQDLY
jgi:hypothetical protein